MPHAEDYEELHAKLLALQQRLAMLEEAERRRDAAEEALRISEEKFRVISEQSMMGILVLQDSKAKFVNEAFARMVGYSLAELNVMPPSEQIARIIHSQDRDFVIDQINRKMRGDRDVVTNYPLRIVSSDGEVRWVEIYSKTVRFQGRPADLVTMTDITARKKAEEERENLQAQVLHAQKLESLGVLAGGIAHDFNNLLSSVRGSAELALEHLPAGHPARAHVDEIRRAAEKATDLARRMLIYAGRGHTEPELLDLSDLVEDMRHLFRVSVPRNARLDIELLPSPPAIYGDAGQIRQVILNLLVNAAEAIEKDGGHIRVRTGVLNCTREVLRSTWIDRDLPEGEYVFLEVEDDGKGMDKETLSRIFDPFFSTKFAGRGLGLASTLGIIRGMDATIHVESSVGRGSIFRVCFLATKDKAPPKGEKETAASEEWQGEGVILLVEDEETVRNVTRRLLEVLGFEVEVAVNGNEGWKTFQENAGRYRLVMADMTMPGMSGEELLERIRQRNDDLPVLITSGFDELETQPHYLGGEKTSFLSKPFGITELRQQLSELLS